MIYFTLVINTFITSYKTLGNTLKKNDILHVTIRRSLHVIWALSSHIILLLLMLLAN